MQNNKPKYLTFGCKVTVLLYSLIILNYQWLFYNSLVTPVENYLNGNQVGGQIMSFIFALIASFYNPLLFRFDIVLILINLLVIFFFVPLIETKYSSSFVIKQIVIHNIYFQVAFTLLPYFQFQNSLYYICLFICYIWLPITIYKVDTNFNQGKIKTIGSPFFIQKNYQSSIILIILCSKIWSYFLYSLVIYYILKWLGIINIESKDLQIKQKTYCSIQNTIPSFLKNKSDYFKWKNNQQKQQKNELQENNNQNIIQNDKKTQLETDKKTQLEAQIKRSSFKQYWQMKQRPEDLQKPQSKQIDTEQQKKRQIQLYKQAHKIKQQFAQGSVEYKQKWKNA